MHLHILYNVVFSLNSCSATGFLFLSLNEVELPVHHHNITLFTSRVSYGEL